MIKITKRPSNWKRGDPETLISTARNATNIRYAPKRRRARKKALPTKSFALAYHTMLPSKERRRVMDTSLFTSPYSVADAVEADNLTTCIQGTQIDQRLHNSIYVSYLKIRGNITQKGVAARGVRIVVFKEHNYNDFDPATMANFFKNNVWNDTAPTGKGDDGRYVVNRDRYMVLFDRKYLIKPSVECGSRNINENIRIGRKFFYPQKDPTFTDPIDGRLLVVVMAYEPDDVLRANSDPVIIDLQYRLFFKDYKKIYGTSRIK